MPRVNGKVIAVKNNGEPVWQKGDIKMWEVTLDVNGRQADVKTYSAAVARYGFSGELEAYEKQGRNGSETFVKQVQQEGAGSYGGYNRGGGGKSYQSKDEGAIRAMWAISQSIAWHVAPDNDEMKVSFNPETVEDVAVTLFHMVDRVKAAPAPAAKPSPNIQDVVDTPFGTVSTPDQDELNSLFRQDDQQPWPNA